MSSEKEMNRIIKAWSVAEQRAPVKHLVAFETLGLNIRCRKPSKEEVKKAWHQLSMRLHPDRNADNDELATEAMQCINLAKQHLFKVHFGEADARVNYYHEPDREEAQAREDAEAKAAAEAAEAAEAAAVAAAEARLAAEPAAQEAEPAAQEAEPAAQEAELAAQEAPCESSLKRSVSAASAPEVAPTEDSHPMKESAPKRQRPYE